jgi:hypothetical protein
MALNIADTSEGSRDPANRKIRGRVVSESLSFPLIQTKSLGDVICRRELKKKSYPLAEISFPANRNVFRYQPGDLFVLQYDMYNIDSMVCRIEKIEEAGPESEIITVYAKEDIYYISSTIVSGITSKRTVRIYDYVVDLSYVEAFEVPYFLIKEEDIRVGIVAGRENQKETGYFIYGSVGEISYSKIGSQITYAIHGTLVTAYSATRNTIDDSIGFQVDFDNTDVSAIETISRTQLFTFMNSAIIGTPSSHEIIAFQTITPVVGHTNRFLLENVISGMYDTERLSHVIGSDFTYVGSNGMKILNEDWMTKNGTRYFKAVPYGNKDIGDIDTATEKRLF